VLTVPIIKPSGLNYLLENSKKIEKHSGIVNYKFDKSLASEILGIDNIVGGNFFETPNPFHVHVDTGLASDKFRPKYNLLIPMSEEKDHKTVIFDQTYNGEASHFMVGSIYKYWPDPVYNKRKTDFRLVEGLQNMCIENYVNYLTHIPYESVKDLSIKKVIDWKMYQPIIFESKYLHCSSNFNGIKKGLTLLIAL